MTKSFIHSAMIAGTFLLSSCSYFIDNFVEDSPQVVSLEGKDLSIVFSHNVNGETHPCGCRHFPLGGIPQVAGAISKIEKTNTVVYVDTGDTLFNSTKIPENLDKSKSYNAKELLKGLSRAGLRYWVPGDQDFAKGPEFLNEAAKEAKVSILLSNLKEPEKGQKSTIEHIDHVIFNNGPHKIFMVGLLSPQVLANKYKSLVKHPQDAMKDIIKMLEAKGYDKNSKFHRFVVLSHSGIGPDESLAKSYPKIDWIVGAHTMNFFRFPQEEGNTKIVQTLSRNHYLGHITFTFKSDKTKDSYEIIEIRDELKDELKPNPHLAWIDAHKEKLSKIQEEEQAEMLTKKLGVIRYSTSNSCVDCHQPQTDFWQGTSHSIAYQTLRKAGEENNLSCVKCHSLGLNEPRGFKRVQDLLEFDKARSFDPDITDPDEIRKNYWTELDKAFNAVVDKEKSVRQLKPKKRRELAQIWSKHDRKQQVNRNFANVQCLNCHDQHFNHPFDDHDPKPSRAQTVAKMKDKCLTCHDPDQSPEWYHKQDNGLPGAVNQEVLSENFKKMSCPAHK